MGKGVGGRDRVRGGKGYGEGIGVRMRVRGGSGYGKSVWRGEGRAGYGWAGGYMGTGRVEGQGLVSVELRH